MSEVEHFSWWVQHRRHIPTLSLDHFTGIDARSADAFASEGFGIVRVEAFAAELGSVLEGLGVAIDADAAPALNRSPSLIEHTYYFDVRDRFRCGDLLGRHRRWGILVPVVIDP